MRHRLPVVEGGLRDAVHRRVLVDLGRESMSGAELARRYGRPSPTTLSQRDVPGMIDRLTPHIDEQRELARGNQAVALFYGLVSASVILGVSLVVAAAVLGGLQSGAGILSPPYTVKQQLSGGSAEVPDARGSESTTDTVSP